MNGAPNAPSSNRVAAPGEQASGRNQGDSAVPPHRITTSRKRGRLTITAVPGAGAAAVDATMDSPMSRSPRPGGADPITPPTIEHGDRVLLRAEQALLGAILLNPAQLDGVTWLRPDDFTHPAHTALFAAARDLAQAGHPAPTTEGPPPLAWLADVTNEASTRTRGLTMHYLHTLAGACPHAEHAPVYGRMVLESAVRRRILQHATRLHLSARAALLHGDVGEALRHADALTRTLNDQAERWGIRFHPVRPFSSLTAQVAAPGATTTASDDQAETERSLLALLTDRPTTFDEVRRWLRPEDFAVPAHASLYQCIGALVHRGEPVDQVTLLWEAQRRGLTRDADGRARLAAIGQGPGAGAADWLAEQVVRASLTRALTHTAHQVKEVAEDPRYSPGQLIRYAHQALDQVADFRARWETARTGEAPAPRGYGAEPKQVGAALARSPRPISHTHLAPHHSGEPPRTDHSLLPMTPRTPTP